MSSSNSSYVMTSVSPTAEENAEFNVPASSTLVSGRGDLMYWDNTAKQMKPASALADLGSAALMQAAFAQLYMGLSNMQNTIAGDTTVRPGRILVETIVWDFPCVSGTFEVGDYVAPNYTASALQDQVLVKVTDAQLAIGRVVKRYPSNTTTVKARLQSRLLLGLLTSGNVSGGTGLYATPLPLLHGRNSDGSALAAAASSGKFGCTVTLGTTVVLVGEAAQNNTKTDTVLFDYVLPQSYVRGAALTLTINAKHVEAAGTTLTNTIQPFAYTVGNDGTSSADLIGASATAITGTAADYTFTIPGATLTPGTRLVIKVVAVATEGGNTGTTTDNIGSVRLS